jgi:hypothetical protein
MISRTPMRRDAVVTFDARATPSLLGPLSWSRRRGHRDSGAGTRAELRPERAAPFPRLVRRATACPADNEAGRGGVEPCPAVPLQRTVRGRETYDFVASGSSPMATPIRLTGHSQARAEVFPGPPEAA